MCLNKSRNSFALINLHSIEFGLLVQIKEQKVVFVVSKIYQKIT